MSAIDGRTGSRRTAVGEKTFLVLAMLGLTAFSFCASCFRHVPRFA